MELIETYPIATVCQVLDYPRSQVYYRPQAAADDESDERGDSHVGRTASNLRLSSPHCDAETPGTSGEP